MDTTPLQTYSNQISDIITLIESLKNEIQELKNDNALLREENDYLKKKIFGTKSEKSSALGINQLFFEEAEQVCEPELLKVAGYTKAKKKTEYVLDVEQN